MGFEPEFDSVGPHNEALNPRLYNVLLFSRGSWRIFFRKKREKFPRIEIFFEP